MSYLIGVFIFATIVGQVGNVITNRNANRLEFERLLDGAKTYMRHHKVPGGMKRRVLRWYDYSWSRGRIQGGGDINTALGLLPDKLKTELALHVNLSVLKKVSRCVKHGMREAGWWMECAVIVIRVITQQSLYLPNSHFIILLKLAYYWQKVCFSGYSD